MTKARENLYVDRTPRRGVIHLTTDAFIRLQKDAKIGPEREGNLLLKFNTENES